MTAPRIPRDSKLFEQPADIIGRPRADEASWRDQIERHCYIPDGCDQQGRLAPGATARAQGGSWYTPAELVEFARSMQNAHPQAAEAATDVGDYSPIPTHRARLARWLAVIWLMLFATLTLIANADIIVAAVRAAGAAL